MALGGNGPSIQPSLSQTSFKGKHFTQETGIPWVEKYVDLKTEYLRSDGNVG
jgi:hypothetical protein